MVKRRLKVYTEGKNEYRGYIVRTVIRTRKIGKTTFELYRVCGEPHWTTSKLREVFLPYLCIFKLRSKGDLK